MMMPLEFVIYDQVCVCNAVIMLFISIGGHIYPPPLLSSLNYQFFSSWSYITFSFHSLGMTESLINIILPLFQVHGFCRNNECGQSHNINRIVKVLQTQGAKKQGDTKYTGPKTGSLVSIIEKFTKAQEKVKTQKRPSPENAPEPKRSRVSLKEEKPEQITKVTKEGLENPSEYFRGTNGHRAGYDAFMTGFIFASIVSEKGLWTSKDDPFSPKNIGLSDQVNKVYLMGKNIPFLIRTGAYANRSSKHCSKIEKVRSDSTLRHL